MEIISRTYLRIDVELRRKVSSKLPSINQAMLRKSWFYLSKTTHFVMPTKKQTRQRNARNRRNHHRKHHRKATCAKLFGAPVSTPISTPKSMRNRSKSLHFRPRSVDLGRSGLQVGPPGSILVRSSSPGEPRCSILGRSAASLGQPG